MRRYRFGRLKRAGCAIGVGIGHIAQKCTENTEKCLDSGISRRSVGLLAYFCSRSETAVLKLAYAVELGVCPFRGPTGVGIGLSPVASQNYPRTSGGLSVRLGSGVIATPYFGLFPGTGASRSEVRVQPTGHTDTERTDDGGPAAVARSFLSDRVAEHWSFGEPVRAGRVGERDHRPLLAQGRAARRLAPRRAGGERGRHRERATPTPSLAEKVPQHRRPAGPLGRSHRTPRRRRLPVHPRAHRPLHHRGLHPPEPRDPAQLPQPTLADRRRGGGPQALPAQVGLPPASPTCCPLFTGRGHRAGLVVRGLPTASMRRRQLGPVGPRSRDRHAERGDRPSRRAPTSTTRTASSWSMCSVRVAGSTGGARPPPWADRSSKLPGVGGAALTSGPTGPGSAATTSWASSGAARSTGRPSSRSNGSGSPGSSATSVPAPTWRTGAGRGRGASASLSSTWRSRRPSAGRARGSWPGNG